MVEQYLTAYNRVLTFWLFPLSNSLSNRSMMIKMLVILTFAFWSFVVSPWNCDCFNQNGNKPKTERKRDQIDVTLGFRFVFMILLSIHSTFNGSSDCASRKTNYTFFGNLKVKYIYSKKKVKICQRYQSEEINRAESIGILVERINERWVLFCFVFFSFCCTFYGQNSNIFLLAFQVRFLLHSNGIIHRCLFGRPFWFNVIYLVWYDTFGCSVTISIVKQFPKVFLRINPNTINDMCFVYIGIQHSPYLHISFAQSI